MYYIRNSSNDMLCAGIFSFIDILYAISERTVEPTENSFCLWHVDDRDDDRGISDAGNNKKYFKIVLKSMVASCKLKCMKLPYFLLVYRKPVIDKKNAKKTDK